MTSLTPLNGDDSRLNTFGMFLANITSPVTAIETFSLLSKFTEFPLSPLNVTFKNTKRKTAKIIATIKNFLLAIIVYSSAISASSSSLNS